MNHRDIRSTVRRLPATLLTMVSASLGVLLAACGGDGDPVPSAPPAWRVQHVAHAAVARGLVGATFTHLTPTTAEQGWAGVRAMGQAHPIEPGDWFLLGSNAKAMTAAVAARLVEQGALAWTTTLAEALPDLAAGMRDPYRSVTLEQLLAHRGGVLAMNNAEDIGRFAAHLAAQPQPLPATREGRDRLFAAWVLSQPSPPGVTPGRDHAYSNAGYALVARMLEARTGRSFAQLFQQEMAEPLGVAVRWIALDEAATDRPQGHVGMPGQASAPVPLSVADEARWAEVLRPGGVDLAITPAAYTAWMQWNLRALSGQPTPLPAGYVSRLRALQPGVYDMGWIAARLPDGRPVLVHSGEWNGFNSHAVLDQAGRSGSFGFTNVVAGEATDGASWTLGVLDASLLEMETRRPAAP